MASCVDSTWQIRMPNASSVYDAIRDFSFAYAPIHAYLTAALCPIGALLNLFNVIVLTRPSMRTTVNTILTAIAICDTLVMSSNLIFVIHFILNASKRCDHSDYAYWWALFALLHAHAAIIGHTTSSWLSVAMAAIRFATIRGAERGKHCPLKAIHAAIFSIIILLLVCLGGTPIFVSYSIRQTDPAMTLSTCWRYSGLPPNRTLTWLKENGTTRPATYMPYAIGRDSGDCSMLQLAFWTTGILFKVAPCLFLAVFMGLLMSLLSSVHVRRRRLKLSGTANSVRGQGSPVKSDRTTKMLVAVLAIFLVTELPQGLVAIFSGIFSREFRHRIYNPLGNFLDFLSLINSSANFIILCSMSKKFRQTFVSLFVPQNVYHKLGQIEGASIDLREKLSTTAYIRSAAIVSPKIDASAGPSSDH